MNSKLNKYFHASQLEYRCVLWLIIKCPQSPNIEEIVIIAIEYLYNLNIP